MILLHGFIKKTQKTPPQELELAFKRKKTTGIMEKIMRRKNPHIGSSFDDFLKEEGIYEEIKASTSKRLLAMQMEKEMKKKTNFKKQNGEGHAHQSCIA
jgi:predicted GIY-YIG superfamily endonuclease